MLEPCARCARHVRTTEVACPFCGTARVPRSATPSSISPLARLSRAAVFAGAATLGAACYTNPPPPSTGYQQPPPPPPDPDRNPDADAAAGTIHGTITDHTGTPLARHRVTLQPAGTTAGRSASAITDAQGRYSFADVAPGTYTVTTHHFERSPPPQQVVVVAGGKTAVANFSIYNPPYDPSDIAKPYGAPPARRRVV